jgi:hypothetical protein
LIFTSLDISRRSRLCRGRNIRRCGPRFTCGLYRQSSCAGSGLWSITTPTGLERERAA